MKKLLTLLILLLGGAFTTFAQHGYRGFADVSAGVGTNLSYESAGFSTNLSTTHGYQLNSHIFLGGGAQFGYCTGDYIGISLPLYAQFRYDYSLLSKKSLYAGCRVGYDVLTSGPIPYISPEIGIRFGTSSSVSLNLGLRFTISNNPKYTISEYNPWYWIDHDGIIHDFSYTNTWDITDDVFGSATITFGIEF